MAEKNPTCQDTERPVPWRHGREPPLAPRRWRTGARTILRLFKLDVPFLARFIVQNLATVYVFIHVFESWVCDEGTLVACCSFTNANWLPSGWFPLNLSLATHTVAYAAKAFSYARADPNKHLNLVYSQFAWFYFMACWYARKYERELDLYVLGEVALVDAINGTSPGLTQVAAATPLSTSNRFRPWTGFSLWTERHRAGHPCPERAYFSSCMPIWEDFIYNTAGHLCGFFLHRVGRGWFGCEGSLVRALGPLSSFHERLR